jgi:hypothetical protein
MPCNVDGFFPRVNMIMSWINSKECRYCVILIVSKRRRFERNFVKCCAMETISTKSRSTSSNQSLLHISWLSL